MTITDKTTGKRLEDHELDSALEFDDAAHCRSVVAQVGPLPDSNYLATVLTCREITSI